MLCLYDQLHTFNKFNDKLISHFNTQQVMKSIQPLANEVWTERWMNTKPHKQFIIIIIH